MANSYAASTLWTRCSALSAYLKISEGKPLQTYSPKLFAWLNRKTEDHVPKQAAVFEKEALFRFWQEAPNDPQHLLLKLIMALGYYDALRRF